MSTGWDDTDISLNDRYEPIKRLGRGTFGLVLQAKFREYPEPHPCLLGAKADLSAGIRGHTIPDVVDLVSDSETGEESMGDGRSSVDKFTKVDNLMLAIDASLHLDKDWWKVLADAIPAEQCEAQVKGMIEKFATEAVKREEEERLHPSMAEAKRELEVLKYEYEMERESLPPLGTTVAVKKMYRDPKSGDSFSREALRELKLLVEASHPHIVRIYEVFLEKQAIHMSMEILKSNLDKVIRDTSILLSAGDVKQYMRMTLLALNYLHSVGMCHRDLKPENLLIGDDGVLKLADFGGAKLCGTPEMMSPQACTLWYRAPELLMGCRSYGTASDIWSAGCIFGELFRRSALFQGTTDLEQLALIVSVCGTPTEDNWPGVTSLTGYVEFEQTPGVPLKELFGTCTNACLDLLSSMLSLNPSKRPTAEEALNHPYFTSEAPAPTPVNMLPKIGTK